MDKITLLKNRRKECEENDLCFYSKKFIRSPKEIFHPLIGFVTVSEVNVNKLNNTFKVYANKKIKT